MSLMQMVKTSQAVGRLYEEGILYMSLLTDPTYGGVSASYATLGDVLISEPEAHIGFAGPDGDRADDPPDAARRLPDGRLPDGARDARPRREAREHPPHDPQPARVPRARRGRARRERPRRAAARDRGRRAGLRPRGRSSAGRPGTSSSARASSSARTRSTTWALVFDDFLELHGDRLFEEDSAIVGGLARLGELHGDADRPPEGQQHRRDDGAQLRHARAGGLPQGHAADALRRQVRHADRDARRHRRRLSRPRRRGARPVERDRRVDHAHVAAAGAHRHRRDRRGRLAAARSRWPPPTAC